MSTKNWDLQYRVLGLLVSLLMAVTFSGVFNPPSALAQGPDPISVGPVGLQQQLTEGVSPIIGSIITASVALTNEGNVPLTLTLNYGEGEQALQLGSDWLTTTLTTTLRPSDIGLVKRTVRITYTNGGQEGHSVAGLEWGFDYPVAYDFGKVNLDGDYLIVPITASTRLSRATCGYLWDAGQQQQLDIIMIPGATSIILPVSQEEKRIGVKALAFYSNIYEYTGGDCNPLHNLFTTPVETHTINFTPTLSITVTAPEWALALDQGEVEPILPFVIHYTAAQDGHLSCVIKDGSGQGGSWAGNVSGKGEIPMLLQVDPASPFTWECVPTIGNNPLAVLTGSVKIKTLSVGLEVQDYMELRFIGSRVIPGVNIQNNESQAVHIHVYMDQVGQWGDPFPLMDSCSYDLVDSRTCMPGNGIVLTEEVNYLNTLIVISDTSVVTFAKQFAITATPFLIYELKSPQYFDVIGRYTSVVTVTNPNLFPVQADVHLFSKFNAPSTFQDDRIAPMGSSVFTFTQLEWEKFTIQLNGCTRYSWAADPSVGLNFCSGDRGDFYTKSVSLKSVDLGIVSLLPATATIPPGREFVSLPSFIITTNLKSGEPGWTLKWETEPGLSAYADVGPSVQVDSVSLEEGQNNVSLNVSLCRDDASFCVKRQVTETVQVGYFALGLEMSTPPSVVLGEKLVSHFTVTNRSVVTLSLFAEGKASIGTQGFALRPIGAGEVISLSLVASPSQLGVFTQSVRVLGIAPSGETTEEVSRLLTTTVVAPQGEALNLIITASEVPTGALRSGIKVITDGGTIDVTLTELTTLTLSTFPTATLDFGDGWFLREYDCGFYSAGTGMLYLDESDIGDCGLELVFVAHPEISISVTPNSIPVTVEAGKTLEITYTVTVNNPGNVEVKGLQVSIDPTLPRDGRIVGGTVVIDGKKYQWFANLGYCGGALISPEWVLTAAHCEVSLGDPIRFGSLEKSKGGVTVTAIEWHPHPNYNSRNNDFDYGLVRVSRPITEVNPVTLAVSLPLDGELLWIAGFGRTCSTCSGSPFLLEAQVPLVNQQDLIAIYLNYSPITQRMFGAGYVGGKYDTCQGDSGSGIYNPQLQLIGLTSWGNGCALPGWPGVYADLTAFGVQDWIWSVATKPTPQPDPNPTVSLFPGKERSEVFTYTTASYTVPGIYTETVNLAARGQAIIWNGEAPVDASQIVTFTIEVKGSGGRTYLPMILR